MATVKEVIQMLSHLDPEETIALTGWWVKSDVESNNGVKLSEDQWQEIVDSHEDNTEIHIDEIVSNLLEEEEEE
jgi:hypothetical protein